MIELDDMIVDPKHIQKVECDDLKCIVTYGLNHTWRLTSICDRSQPCYDYLLSKEYLKKNDDDYVKYEKNKNEDNTPLHKHRHDQYINYDNAVCRGNKCTVKYNIPGEQHDRCRLYKRKC